jgi:hypothetical protein
VVLFLAFFVAIFLSGAIYYSSSSTQVRQGDAHHIGNTPEILSVFNFLEYTFVIDGADIFPNESIKHDIVVELKSSKYDISKLEYSVLDHSINASDVIVQAYPSRIDDTNTKVDIVIYAEKVQVTGLPVNKSYENMNLYSIYGIYDKANEKMTVHMPLPVAISLLL